MTPPKKEPQARAVYLVPEVAELLGVSERHVIDLIEEGLIGALNVAGGTNWTERRFFRIPVAAYEKFRKERWQADFASERPLSGGRHQGPDLSLRRAREAAMRGTCQRSKASKRRSGGKHA
jgi:excisionase family DNA binding protein